MRKLIGIGLVMAFSSVNAQEKMSPELLWKLGRVSAETISADGKNIIFGVSRYNMDENKGERNLFSIPVKGGVVKQLTEAAGGESVINTDLKSGRITYLYKGQLWIMNADGKDKKQLTNFDGELANIRVSPDGKHILFSKEVQILKIKGSDRYPDMQKSEAFVFDDLMYRHWDSWEDGKFQHIFIASYDNGKIGEPTDIMKDEPYDCPQMPFGGSEDAIWSPDSKFIVYVAKKKFGKEYAVSTNTDIYFYDVQSGRTTNLTEGMMGYDTNPAFNKDGSAMAWLSMKEDGYESDKNDLVLYDFKTLKTYNLTAAWDGTVSSWKWSNDGSKIYFVAAVKGTEQLFEISNVLTHDKYSVKNLKQLTKGQFDISDITGQAGSELIVTRTDMNHAAELYRVDPRSGNTIPLTSVNNDIYSHLALSKIEERHIKTTDNKDMLAWVIYPPNFDPSKKYPTLLYCQGGPQSALTQFYSFRWNFQLIAAQGYIIIAPNRRGMPGYGVEWNKAISGDWGGQPIRDYLSAIDDIAKEPYVDKNRLGAVGASYGGYSIYMLAGVHNNRFKTFIAHDGLFDLRSWYGTTEELWFANKDAGGPYWGNKRSESYKNANPIEYADKWNTPIMIVQGGIDYRVPVEQGLGAFQLAQLKGIKSRLLYLPNENHWVMSPQNAIVWQREFFKWLQETL